MDLLTANDPAGEHAPSAYAAAAGPQPLRPAAEGAIRADVCVIGGGFTGLSAALHLARRGYRVVLLEAQRAGFGASGRNGGQIGQGQRVDQSELERMLGREHAHALWRIATQAVDLVRALAAEALIATPVHDGLICADHRARFVSGSLAEARKLREEYAYDKIEGLDRDALRALVDSPVFHGGTLDLGAGHLDPLRFALGLARAAEAAGAEIFERSRVVRLDAASPAKIATDRAEITAEHVVLACNGYLGDLAPEVAARVMPINNFIVATEPLPAERRERLIRNNYAVADSKFVVNYFRFSEDGRLLFGGAESYGYRFPKRFAEAVRRSMLWVYPQLSDVRIDYAWGG
ncbi:MAG: FAD-binding oxidoreductase, partial [Pseudomonadota bacterium]